MNLLLIMALYALIGATAHAQGLPPVPNDTARFLNSTNFPFLHPQKKPPEPAADQAAAPAHLAAKNNSDSEPRELFWKGQGAAKTRLFHMDGPWELRWHSDGDVMIYVYPPPNPNNGNFILSHGRSGTSHFVTSGDYLLAICRVMYGYTTVPCRPASVSWYIEAIPLVSPIQAIARSGCQGDDCKARYAALMSLMEEYPPVFVHDTYQFSHQGPPVYKDALTGKTYAANCSYDQTAATYALMIPTYAARYDWTIEQTINRLNLGVSNGEEERILQLTAQATRLLGSLNPNVWKEFVMSDCKKRLSLVSP
jgi:hypothetical protein